MKNCTIIALVLGLLLSVGVGLSAQGYEGHSFIETEHTRIIFEPHLSETAAEIAEFADEAYASVTGLLGYTPSERVPVVVTDRTAWANGYYSPLPHRIVLFVTSPANRFLGSRTESWLRTLYVHELTHYVHLTMPVGLGGLLSHVLGPDLKAISAGAMPLWWIEGIAMYAESRLEPGGRGDSALFELSYKAPILQDQMWHRHQLRYASAYSPPDRAYIGGYLMVSHLIDTFGSGVFADINRWFVRFPGLGIGFAIRVATGESFSTLYDAMIEQYEADWQDSHISDELGAAVMESPIGHFFTPQATERGMIGYTRSARDSGSMVVYSDSLQIQERFAVGRLSDDLSWSVSGDGRTALVAAVRADNLHSGGINMAPQGYSELYRLDFVTGERNRITDGARLYHPALNHDGSIAVAVEISNSNYRLVAVDMTSGTIETVYEADNGSVYQPQLSAAGDFAVLVEVVHGKSALIQVDISDGTAEYLIPPSKAAIYHPRLNDSVTFSSDADGRLSLYRLDESGIVRLLDDPVGAVGGEYMYGESGDQPGILYGVYRAGGYSLRYAEHDVHLETQLEWPETESRDEADSGEPAHAIEPLTYLDVPRPGFWLPYPRIDRQEDAPLGVGFSPAAYWLMGSTLGRNMIQGTVDYYLPHNQPSVWLDYRHQRSWGWIGARAESRYMGAAEVWGRRNSIGITLNRLLYDTAFLNHRQNIRGQVALDYRSFSGLDRVSELDASLRLGYSASRSAPRAAFFGGNNVSAAAGISSRVLFAERPSLLYLPQLSAAVQATLPSLYPVARLEADMIYSTSGTLDGVLLPRGGPLWQEYDLPLKLRLTSLLRLPLGMFDRWVPYGGLTAAGMSLFTQSAFYADPQQHTGGVWEGRLYAGVELAVDLVMFAGASVRPVLGLNTRIDPSSGYTPAGWEDVHLYFDLIM